MRILFIFTVLFFLSDLALGQTKIDTTYYQIGTERRIKKIEKTSGKKKEVIIFYENGKIKEHYKELEGKKEGEYETFDYAGNLSLKVAFDKGLRQGKEVEYYSNGKRKSECYYVNNFKMGPSKIWNEKGDLIVACSYDTLNVKNKDKTEIVSVFTGKYTSYYIGEKIEKDCFYAEGKLEGLSREWYWNGSLKSEIIYRQGLVHGKKILYFENGQKQFEGYEINPKKIIFNGQYITEGAEGKQIYYYITGRIQTIEEYRNRIPEGDWFWYDEQGSMVEQRSFTGGQTTKNHIYYYSSNNVKQQTPYEIFQVNGKDTGLIHGKVLYYHPNGKLASMQTYVKGNLYGISESYTEYGNLERQLFLFGNYDRYAILKEYSPKGILLREGDFCLDSSEQIKFKAITKAINYLDGTPYYTFERNNCNALGFGKTFYPDGKTMSETVVFIKNDDDYLVSDACGTAWQALYYPNGNLWYEVFKVNNYPIGETIEWFPDGKLKRYVSPNGLDIQWFQDGTLMTSFVYSPFNNQGRDTILEPKFLLNLYANLSTAKQSRLNLKAQDGSVRSYYANGKTKFETTLKKGSLDAYFLGYGYDGDTMVYIEILNHKLDGKFLVKNENNTPHMVGSYANGREVGKWEKYNRIGLPQVFYDYHPNLSGLKPFSYEYNFYEDGKLKNRAGYFQGKLNGWNVSYHPNGKPSDSIYYEKDTLNGWYISYTEEAKPYSIGCYKKNKKNGIHKSWYYKVNNSNLMRQETYLDGERNGEALYYYGNGVLQLQAFFKLGKEDSLWVYFDTLGNIESRTLYKMGTKLELTETLGPCGCSVQEEGTTQFAQRLSSLLEDNVDLNLWQFPFHENITPLLDKTFFRGLQTNGNRNGNQYSFSWVVFKPLKIGIPNAAGIKLVLNPCWKPRQESELEVDLFLINNRPDQTILYVSSPRMAFELPSRLFMNTHSPDKPALASFKVENMMVNEEGIGFNGAASICVSETYLLNKNYTLSLDTFVVNNLMAQNYDGNSAYEMLYLEVEIPKTHLNYINQYPRLMKEGAGNLRFKWKNDVISSQVKGIQIASHFVLGQIHLKVDSVENGKLVITTAKGKVMLLERELCEQLLKDGFTVAKSYFNKEENTLEIRFYIYQK